jgi:hypothetical protein
MIPSDRIWYTIIRADCSQANEFLLSHEGECMLGTALGLPGWSGHKNERAKSKQLLPGQQLIQERVVPSRSKPLQ